MAEPAKKKRKAKERMRSDPPKKKRDDRAAMPPPPTPIPFNLAVTPYEDLGLKINAQYGQIQEAYGTRTLRLNPDATDPHHPDHKRLREFGKARDILLDSSLRRVLDLCLRRACNEKTIKAWHILGIHESADNEDVKQRYEAQLSRWIGYERYHFLIVTVMASARDWMYKRNAHFDRYMEERNAIPSREDSAGPEITSKMQPASNEDKNSTDPEIKHKILSSPSVWPTSTGCDDLV